MIICYIVLIDVVDMWVYRRFFSWRLLYIWQISLALCMVNVSVIRVFVIKIVWFMIFFCKVCDGRWNNRCPKIRGILIWLLAYDQYIFRFGKKYFFLEFWMHQIDMKIDICIVWICPNMSKCVLLCVWKVNFFCIVWVIQMFVSTFPSSGRHKHQHDAD